MTENSLILVTGAKPRKGPITHLECWEYDHTERGTQIYTKRGWVDIEEVKREMVEGILYRAARFGEDRIFAEGAFLELIVQAEDSPDKWDNLSEMRKRYRGP